MASYVNTWFGLQSTAGASVSGGQLKITDALDADSPTVSEISIDLLDTVGGWYLLGVDGWGMNLAQYKGNGVYLDSSLTDGNALKYAVFDTVTETLNLGLNFFSPNDLINRIDEFNQLVKIRCRRFWTDSRYNKPVYLVRQIPGEGSVSYCLINDARLVLPRDMWDVTCNLDSGRMFPVNLIIERQPFWLGAPPGQTQATLLASARQVWNYDLDWTQADSTPGGQIYSTVLTTTGDIYAGGASEILLYTGGTWAVVSTSPVTLAENVTAAIELNNGDLLFGGNGRIIKLSGGTWSVETTEPTGQVYALLQALSGEVYAGDSGRIIKRDINDTWAEDDDLPDGDVYALFQTTTGRLLAGEPGRILRTKASQEAQTVEVSISSGTDDAEELDDGSMSLDSDDIDFFQNGFKYYGLRFQNVAVPQGATINSAIVRFTAEDDDSGSTGEVQFYAEDTDNASTFTSTSNDISTRTATTATVSWTGPSNWRRNKKYDSPELKTIVQEIVDRVGWASGNALAILGQRLTAGNDRDAHTYDGKPGSAAELIITYTEARVAGDTWEVASTLPTGNVRSFYQVGDRIIIGEDGRFLASHDDGESFEELDTTPGVVVLTIAADAEGILYAGDDAGVIYRSTDSGSNWAIDNNSLAVGDVYGIIKDSDGNMWAGDNGYLLKLALDSELTLGQEETAENTVMVGNHHKAANLTHILQDRGGSFTSIYPMSTFPTAIFGASFVANDNVYFGVDTSLDDTGPFSSLIFNIDTVASATTSYTIVWEYYNGAWTTLTVQDGTGQFANVGVNTVAWQLPSDWTTTAINGTTGYWVRARLSALTGTWTPPTQAVRDIYSVSTAFIEMDDDQANGDIPSLVKLQFNNRSAAGGPGGSSPLLYTNRVLAGVKPKENHTNFRAFLNFADEQNPEGVTLDVTVDGDSATSVEDDTNFSAITGRRTFFDASSATLDSLADRVALKLSTDIARDYYGKYRAFLRCKQNGGSAGEVTIRLKVVSGTGGVSMVTDRQQTQTTTDHHLIEFEQVVSLPVSSLFSDSDIGDETQIVVQILAEQSDADLYLYDLFLLPVDNAYVDATDQANTATSAVDNEARLLIDSISSPRTSIRTLVQKTASDLFKATYMVDSRGELALPTVGDTRIWFLAARTTGAGTNVWISEPEAVHSVRGWRVDRWLLGRGLG